MNLEDLKKKLAEALDIPDYKTDFAFEVFKRALAERLATNQAVNVPGVGVFQLRREPVPREERQGGRETKTFILFSPPEIAEKEAEKAFIQIPVRDYKTGEIPDPEDLFSLSPEKPIIPASEEDEKSGVNVRDKISEMLANSEMLENFELFDSFFPKETSETETVSEDILRDELSNVESTEKEYVGEEETETENISEQPAEAEHEKVDGDDLESEVATEEEELSEESEDTASDESEENEVPEPEENVSEETEERKEEESDVERDATEEDPFGALEETINEAVEEEEIPEEELEKILEADENKEGFTSPAESSAKHFEPEKTGQETETSSQETKSKKKYYFIGAGILLLIIYLIFFTGGEESKQKVVIKKENPPKQKTEKIVAKLDSAKPVKPVSRGSTDLERTKAEWKKKIQKSEKKSSNSLYRKIGKEKRVGSLITYDGSQYIVQVSSWRNPSVAEVVAKQWRSKGFDAFIVKSYVRKKRKYYYRVKIGGFDSIEKAKEFQIKYNIK